MARGLAEIVAEHGLTELIVDTKETTLTVRRGGVASRCRGRCRCRCRCRCRRRCRHRAAPRRAAPRRRSRRRVVDDKAHVVTSPFVGTFYRKPNPDSPSYVALNDKVEKGQVLCIVEAMKLMNEIEAEVAGTVVGILVENGAPVEYGQPLFKIAT